MSIYTNTYRYVYTRLYDIYIYIHIYIYILYIYTWYMYMCDIAFWAVYMYIYIISEYIGYFMVFPFFESRLPSSSGKIADAGDNTTNSQNMNQKLRLWFLRPTYNLHLCASPISSTPNLLLLVRISPALYDRKMAVTLAGRFDIGVTSTFRATHRNAFPRSNQDEFRELIDVDLASFICHVNSAAFPAATRDTLGI